jgi:hypothetical protein
MGAIPHKTNIKNEMNNSELAHAWAHQVKSSGKGSNFFYEGASLYSYGRHFEVARIVEIDGTTVAIMNPDRYSMTTGRHQTEARHAVSHLRQARISPECYRWDRITSAATLAEAVEAQNARAARLVEEAAEEKRARARELRERRKREAEDFGKALDAWRAGGPLPWAARQNPVALRVTGGRIETTHGAQVPVRIAPLAWDLIQRRESDPEFSWDNYRGLAVAGGDLVVGCHRIPLAEVARVAAALGLAA